MYPLTMTNWVRVHQWITTKLPEFTDPFDPGLFYHFYVKSVNSRYRTNSVWWTFWSPV